MMKGERKNVFQVYNRIGDWFAKNRPQDLMEKKYLDQLIGLVGADASVLDIGCGTGKPILNYLRDKKLTVYGVDASEKMLGLAKQNFPDAEFLLEDMRVLNLNQKFNALIAWHSFFHLPTKDQITMFQVFENHIKPKGILLFTSGTENGEAWGINGGQNLFHASLSTDEYQDILKKHQFEVLSHTINDPECGHANVWMVQYNPQ